MTRLHDLIGRALFEEYEPHQFDYGADPIKALATGASGASQMGASAVEQAIKGAVARGELVPADFWPGEPDACRSDCQSLHVNNVACTCGRNRGLAMSDENDWTPVRRKQNLGPAVNTSDGRKRRQWQIERAGFFEIVCTDVEADTIDKMLQTLGARVEERLRAQRDSLLQAAEEARDTTVWAVMVAKNYQKAAPIDAPVALAHGIEEAENILARLDTAIRQAKRETEE